MQYPFQIFKAAIDDNEFWIAESTVLTGCSGRGNTMQAALEELSLHEEDWLKLRQRSGGMVPRIPIESLSDRGRWIPEAGDKVRMNIHSLGIGDLDGVEVTESGANYWQYINEHPDEIYEVTGIDQDAFNSDNPCMFQLSGAMAGNTWAADELIHVVPQTRFDDIKAMSFAQMKTGLIQQFIQLCEDGIPSEELVAEWLNEELPPVNAK